MYLKSSTDQEFMKQARAAKVNEAYTPPNKSVSLLQRMARIFKSKWREFLNKKKTKKALFGIKKIPLTEVGIRPEKFKILISFFQIFSNFKDTYNIAWPFQVTNLMAFMSKFNFDFLAIPSIDCVVALNYYMNFW